MLRERLLNPEVDTSRSQHRSSAHTRVGAVLNGKWTLERLLGKGGMGDVYAACHRNGARAAVKILHPSLARIPEVRERFQREGYAANRVAHPGAVQVLDDDVVHGGEDDGTVYLVMELLEGESLDERARRAPSLGEAEILEVMDAVLEVLEAAHAHGVVHRDLKPENVFLARRPEGDGALVKVLDFGLARLDEMAGITNAGIAVGTPSFMAPEQAAGRGEEIDGRTDIFSLGATIFRIVAGRTVHEAEHMLQLVVLMATRPAPRLRARAPGTSETLAGIVDRALAFNREDRYADATAMRRDVRAALALLAKGEDEAVPVTVEEPLAPEEATLPASEAQPLPASREKADDQELPWSPPRPVVLPWLLLAAVIALVGWRFGADLRGEVGRLADQMTARVSATSFEAAAAATAEAQDEPPSAAEPTIELLDDADAGALPARATAPVSRAPAHVAVQPARLTAPALAIRPAHARPVAPARPPPSLRARQAHGASRAAR